MRLSTRFLTLAALAVALMAVPAAADAATTTPPLKQVLPVTGKSASGKQMKGTYTIERFSKARSGRYAGSVVSSGTFSGRLGARRVTKLNVVMPAQLSRAATASQLPPLPNSCQILNLRLGPINLNLLGLVVRTNLINVRIDAQRGAGNLLGNLLCGITGILDPQTAGAANNAAALNALLALVPRR